MSPEDRALHEAQVSLDRQKKHQAETEKLYMAAEEDLVNHFRSSLPTATLRAPAPARPTLREESQLEALLPPYSSRTFSEAMAARAASRYHEAKLR